ncbi:MAG: nitronate monooxygenase [Planctomycetales bacterium]|nr:nitronate monooxygenase [Planctomycetales bacterium]
MNTQEQPIIIQGGMGVAVSGWPLAKAVSKEGQLGVVAGTALDTVLIRRLQLGDAGGHVRRALSEFPYQKMAERILHQYFVPGGKSEAEPFAASQLHTVHPSSRQRELIVVANFVEVYLAKEGHNGLVGVNYLEKIQLPTLPSLYGAMLAGVDYVLMGAGIPQLIPGTLDRLSNGEAVELPLRVADAKNDDKFVSYFDPGEFTNGEVPWLQRPKFLPIVSSATLATMLARKSNGKIDGFVVEGPTAGGHNAPPRGKMQLNTRGEPIYGERDNADLKAMRALDLPFWLAGSYGSPEGVEDSLRVGAAGVQVGTAFAYCRESGITEEIKRQVLQASRTGQLDVFTDPLASPAGFPFKVLRIDGTLSESSCYASRQRQCDLGYLRQAYRKDDGSVGWRCPAEHVDTFTRKGGDENDAHGRKCLCNCLLANVGLGQCRRNGYQEIPMVTSGDEVMNVARFLPDAHAESYSASDVIRHLLSGVKSISAASCT